jgi:hypothetical protein
VSVVHISVSLSPPESDHGVPLVSDNATTSELVALRNAINAQIRQDHDSRELAVASSLVVLEATLV